MSSVAGDLSPTQQAERISDALEGRAVRGGWRAHCPAHEDAHPSLDIAIRDGRVVWICRSGCDQAAVTEALKDRGLWQPEPAPQRSHGRHEASGTYTYVDTKGDHLIKKRFDFPQNGKPHKQCAWYGPEGEKGIGGRTAMWYRSEQLKSLARETPILVLEGEKCVEIAEALGFVATCGPNGSKSKLDRDSLELLFGHEVWLLPDNDDPGREHMRQVQSVLHTSGITAVWIDLPGLGKGDDIEQWHAAGGTPEQLRDLAVTAKDQPAHPRSTAVLIRLLDVKRETTSWLWHPFIPLGKITMMDGDPGVGKSFLTTMIAASVSRGYALPLSTYEPDPPGAVLMLAGEDDLAETVRARAEDMGADLSMVHAMTAVMKEDGEHVLFLDPDGTVAIEDAIKRVQPRLVIVDPVISYLGGKVDTGKANQVRAVLRPLMELGAKYKCAMLLTRHLTKSAFGKALYRGQMSIDFNAAARSVLIVGRDPNNPETLVMAHEKASLSKKSPSLQFVIATGEHGTTVQYVGPTDLTSEQILGEESDEPKDNLEEVKGFLSSLLFDAPLPARTVDDLADQMGYSKRTLRRAREALSIEWERRGVPGRGRGGGEIWIRMPLLKENAAAAYTPAPLPINLTKPEHAADLGQVNHASGNGAGTPHVDDQNGGDSINLSKHVLGQVNPESPSEPLTSDGTRLPYHDPDDDEEIL